MAAARILLHMCCGPCAIYPVRMLQEQGFEVTGLFYNPNVHPLREYLQRREAAAQVGERLGIKIIFKDDEYDPGEYLRRVVFREASRCFLCYQMRLERTAALGRRGRFDHFTTTLLYSKHQKHDLIARTAREVAGGGRPAFYYSDFRQGWKEGIEKSRQWGIYRQQYCGCIYSEAERYRKELDKQKTEDR